MEKLYAGAWRRDLEEAHRNSVSVAGIKCHPERLETPCFSFRLLWDHGSRDMVIYDVRLWCTARPSGFVLSASTLVETVVQKDFVHSRERKQAEMAALLGVLGCSSLSFLSSCTELVFGFGFVFLNLLKGL